MRLRVLCLGALFLLSFPFYSSPTGVQAQTANQTTIKGKVLDSSDDPIADAELKIETESGLTMCRTDNIGSFECVVKGNEIRTLTVRADGFSILRQLASQIQDFRSELVFRLSPGEIRENLVVSTTRNSRALVKTPSSLDVIDKESVESTAAVNLDGVLERSVGFSLFRRADSRTANPTTQGASLRGINPSGASRTNVLLDGIPLNDPFGNWVVWNRVSKQDIERVEVLRGGSSSLYGSGAIGGTISVVPRTTSKDFELSGEISGGNQNTFDGGVSIGFDRIGWNGLVSASTFQTRGFRIVDEDVRGTADDFANSHNTSFSGRIARQIVPGLRISGGARYFGEARNNGTPVQKNRTHFRQFDIGIDYLPNSLTKISLRGFGSTQVLDQNFSAVFGSRNGEILVRLQRVPAQRFGTSGTLATTFRNNALVFGGEFFQTKGSSNEIGFFGGNATSLLGAGGKEERTSVYFQDFFEASDRLSLTGSVRVDRWNNTDGLRTLTRISTQLSTVTPFRNRSETAVSPSASVLYSFQRGFQAYFNAGRSFRAPTLNELYRGFRVGSVITDPNEELVAERATSLEGGVKFSNDNLYLTTSLFSTTVDDAVSNVTFDSGPPLILRQRRNASEIRSRGIEIEGTYRAQHFDLSFGYLLTDSKVLRFQSNPVLIGLDLPQVPRHRITFQLDSKNIKDWIFSLQGTGSTSQFDDDLNQISLGRFGRLDAYASRKFGEGRFFVALQNITNSRASVRLTPVRVVSAPFSIRAGFGWN